MSRKNIEPFGHVHFQWHSDGADPPPAGGAPPGLMSGDPPDGGGQGASAPDVTDPIVGPTWLSKDVRAGYADMKTPEDLRQAYENVKTELAGLSEGRTPIEDYDAYELPYPEGMEKDDGFEKYARGLASELGLTQEQVAKFSSWEHAQQTAATEAEVARLNAEHDATSKALAEKYGDEASSKIAAANKAADKLGLKQFILNSGLKNNLEVMEKFIAISESLSEDTLGSVSSGNEGSGREPGRMTFPESSKNWS